MVIGLHTISVRLKESQDKELERYAKKHQIDKSTATRVVIQEGLKYVKRKEAVENIQSRSWTIWKAADYCGETYRSFLKILRHENVVFPLSVEDLEIELDENRSE